MPDLQVLADGDLERGFPASFEPFGSSRSRGGQEDASRERHEGVEGEDGIVVGRELRARGGT